MAINVERGGGGGESEQTGVAIKVERRGVGQKVNRSTWPVMLKGGCGGGVGGGGEGVRENEQIDVAIDVKKCVWGGGGEGGGRKLTNCRGH